jgi:WD40 repeat protein
MNRSNLHNKLLLSKKKTKINNLKMRDNNQIRSLSVARQKSVVAFLTDKDCIAKIWNYETRKIEHSERLDNANIIAIHPSGLYLAVAYPSLIKLFALIHLDESICMLSINFSKKK